MALGVKGRGLGAEAADNEGVSLGYLLTRLVGGLSSRSQLDLDIPLMSYDGCCWVHLTF